jgi:two-component system sensor histidine kinase YesM
MKKTGIRYRVMLVMLLFATLPVILSTLVSSKIIRDSSEEAIIESNIDRVEWASDYLEEFIVQLDRMFYSLQINEALLESIGSMNSRDLSLQYESQNYMKGVLSTAFYANSRKIENLELYMHQYNKVFQVGYHSSGDVYDMTELSKQWQRLNSAKTNIYFEEIEDKIYAVHSINTFKDQVMFAGISVEVNDSVWQKLTDILAEKTNGEIYIFNDELKLMKGSSPLSKDFEMETLNLKGETNFKEGTLIRTADYYYFVHEVDETKLMVVKAVPKSVIQSKVDNAIKAGVFIVFICIITALIASFYMSHRISKPIVNLADKMKNFQMHDMTTRSDDSLDEINVLEKGYNQMTLRMKELIETEYQHEIELKNAQLLAMQAQMNPHFINNTLNLIGGMALEKDAPDIYDVSKKISDLLRYAIKNNHDMVTLKDELNHVKNYLSIQEKRFEGRCQINWTVEEGIDRILIPKFILQPIVENAFEYGLQGKRGQWLFSIDVFRKNNRVAIVIKDNGVGIKKERLQLIRNRLKTGALEKDASGGIGLLNVSKRLKLRFGPSSGIKIFSEVDNGSLIMLTVPTDYEEGFNHV